MLQNRIPCKSSKSKHQGPAAPGRPQATTPKVKIEPRKASSTLIAFQNAHKRAADRKILRFLSKLLSSKVDGVPGRPELAASRPTFTFGLATICCAPGATPQPPLLGTHADLLLRPAPSFIHV